VPSVSRNPFRPESGGPAAVDLVGQVIDQAEPRSGSAVALARSWNPSAFSKTKVVRSVRFLVLHDAVHETIGDRSLDGERRANCSSPSWKNQANVVFFVAALDRDAAGVADVLGGVVENCPKPSLMPRFQVT